MNGMLDIVECTVALSPVVIAEVIVTSGPQHLNSFENH